MDTSGSTGQKTVTPFTNLYDTIMRNDNTFRIESTIKKKISHIGSDGIVWCGYLLPVEIIYIVEAWKLKPYKNDWILNYAKNQIKIGDCSPGMFYFTVTNKDNERIGLGY